MNVSFVKRSEWRWVISFSFVAILIIFLPLILVLVNGLLTGSDYMGSLHQFVEASSYLSKIEQGARGEWLVSFMHTGERHNELLIFPVYALLGQITRFTFISPQVAFILAQVISGFVMFLGIYHLGATIWTRIRTRRTFFVLASVGSGLGWVVASVFPVNATPDLIQPYFYPYFGLINGVHLPLTIFALCVTLAIILSVFQPGELSPPTVDNGGGVLALMGIAMAFLQPVVLIPLAVTFMISLIGRRLTIGRLKSGERLWFAWMLAPAMPILAYYVLSFRLNPAFELWLAQRAMPAPDLMNLLVALGLPLILAVPAIVRSIRQFKFDADRFVLIWLIVMLISLYIPNPLNWDSTIGLMIPIAYFGARSLEDFWMGNVRRTVRNRLYAAGIPIIVTSYLVVLFIVPIIPLQLRIADDAGMVLPSDYGRAFEWLRDYTRLNDVILASPQVSLWIPAEVGTRVFSGHPTETLNYRAKDAVVDQWMQSADEAFCDRLLGVQSSSIGRYALSYVIIGPLEQLAGTSDLCMTDLTELAEFGSVRVFVTRYGSVTR